MTKQHKDFMDRLKKEWGKLNELMEESANVTESHPLSRAPLTSKDDDVDATRVKEDKVDQGVATSLKVTIQHSSESRAFSTAPEDTAAITGADGERERSHARFTCHACNIACPDAQGFQTHMSSAEHQRRMMEIQRVAQQLPLQSRERKLVRLQWCPICQCRFPGDVIEHRRTKKHKLAKVSARPFCPLCECHFRTPRRFVEHMKSPEHKRRVEEQRNDGDLEVMEELITVDAVGCFEGEDDYEEGNEDQSSAARHQTPITISSEEQTECETYNPDVEYGTSFVVPAAGFLCRLCRKFYHFESSARETHCRSFVHFENLQKHTSQKMQKNLPTEC